MVFEDGRGDRGVIVSGVNSQSNTCITGGGGKGNRFEINPEAVPELSPTG